MEKQEAINGEQACLGSTAAPCYLLSKENFEALKSILECYADDDDYYETTRSCEWVTNGVTEETFHQFDGDASEAKLGLKILQKLTR